MKKQFTQIQVEYWSGSGKTDLDAALDMIKFKREIYGLFFCHLAIEKILKANIVKLTKDHPPRIHELASLLRRTGIEMSNAQHELLGVLMLFHLEGRYSENKYLKV